MLIDPKLIKKHDPTTMHHLSKRWPKYLSIAESECSSKRFDLRRVHTVLAITQVLIPLLVDATLKPRMAERLNHFQHLRRWLFEVCCLGKRDHPLLKRMSKCTIVHHLFQKGRRLLLRQATNKHAQKHWRWESLELPPIEHTIRFDGQPNDIRILSTSTLTFSARAYGTDMHMQQNLTTQQLHKAKNTFLVC